MDNLLYLVHRIPYPPNKGDKIRSFHFLRHLSQHFNVFLGAFIDDDADLAYVNEVKKYCVGVSLIPINTKLRTAISSTGLLTGSSLSVPYYDVSQMHQWVASTVNDHQISKAFVFSSVMAQFVMPIKELDMVADFVDIDSDKWRQYAKKKPWPLSWVYNREAKLLFDFEKLASKNARQVLFVSEKESDMFKKLSPEHAEKVSFVNNGVDVDYFSTSDAIITPYKDNRKVILFTGAMDYWANVDAVVWFSEQVLPRLCDTQKNIVFYIVGSNPTPQVEGLSNDNVVVTGRVEDMRPYLQHAQIIVAPLRIARGVQNKVLEAMAMCKNVVSTPEAMEGIDADIKSVIVAGTANKFYDDVLGMLDIEPFSIANREFVEKNFSWLESGEKLVSLINVDTSDEGSKQESTIK